MFQRLIIAVRPYHSARVAWVGSETFAGEAPKHLDGFVPCRIRKKVRVIPAKHESRRPRAARARTPRLH
jgi:hypothetical protein